MITPKPFLDHRGSFVKVFNKDMFNPINPDLQIEEVFYSCSVQNTIRGFHFQVPPFDFEKLVWVTSGCVLDVVLDLRKNSQTFGKCFSVELSGENKKVIYMPKGTAHAYCVLSEGATVLYCTSRIYSAEHEAGIRWNSVGFTWPAKEPIISEKDRRLPELKRFVSPF